MPWPDWSDEDEDAAWEGVSREAPTLVAAAVFLFLIGLLYWLGEAVERAALLGE